MSASFASFENYLEVTDYKKFDTRNVLPKTIGNYVKILFFPKTDNFSKQAQNLNLTLFAFPDTNFELIFLVRSIQVQISANLWIFRKMP